MQKINDAFKGQKVSTYLLYEFMGTILLSTAYNFNKRNHETMAAFVFIASVWSWDRSCAHFNYAITLGEAMFAISDFRTDWIRYGLIGVT
jgi:hypothetical protein